MLSADRVTPSDDEAIRKRARTRSPRPSTWPSSFWPAAISSAKPRRFARCRSSVLHRLGVSLIGKVRRLALALLRKNPFAVLRPVIDIFEAEDGEILASLGRTRPLFPRLLDTPPAPGERPFATLADLAAATAAVARAAAAVELLTGLGVRPPQLLPEAIEAMVSQASRQKGGSPSMPRPSMRASWPARYWCHACLASRLPLYPCSPRRP